MPSYKPRPLRLHRGGSVVPYQYMIRVASTASFVGQRQRCPCALTVPRAPRAPGDDAKTSTLRRHPQRCIVALWIKSSGCHYPVSTPPNCRSPPLITRPVACQLACRWPLAWHGHSSPSDTNHRPAQAHLHAGDPQPIWIYQYSYHQQQSRGKARPSKISVVAPWPLPPALSFL